MLGGQLEPGRAVDGADDEFYVMVQGGSLPGAHRAVVLLGHVCSPLVFLFVHPWGWSLSWGRKQGLKGRLAG